MDENKGTQVPAAVPEAAKAELPQQPRFSASWQELTAALITYFLAWWYLWKSDLFWGADVDRVWTVIFVLGFVGLTEFLHWGKARPRESWVWLGCMAVITLGIVLDRNRVWEEHALLFLHLAAVWWVLCRSGLLVEGESGHMLPLDGLNGFVIIPFKHFYLRIRALFYALYQPFRNRRKIKTATLLWSLAAVLAALGLFVAAVRLLTAADEGFDALMAWVGDWFRFDWDGEWMLKFLLSLPVGQYLFGLLAGAGREDPETIRQRGGELSRALEAARRVPNLVWTGLTCAFCLLYLVFFAVQSRYLFGAFTRTLPEGFVVAEYARQGFFELCRVMAVNFALLWLVTRFSRQSVRENLPARIACVVLLVESMLFAVVAFSKLALYIDCFGFTPLRLQSSWLVCVLFVGCLAAGYSLLTGKKSFRAWLIFSAVSLSLLCLY